MKKWLIILLAIINPIKGICEEQSSSYPVLPQKTVGNFIVIDSKNPPLNGLWISWPDAHEYSYRLSIERAEWERNVYLQQRAYELEKVRRLMIEKQNLPQALERDKFWGKWGFPIGLTIGVLLTAATTVTIYEIAKR